MPEPDMLEEFLADALVEPAVFELRPDYRALLLAVDGIVPGPGDQASDQLLEAAEAARLTRLGPDVRVVRRLITPGASPAIGDWQTHGDRP